MNKPFKYYFVSIIAFFLLFKTFEKQFLFNFDIITERFYSNEKFYPSDFELIKRTFPYFDYDKNAYKNAINDLKMLKFQKKSNNSNNIKITADLEFAGPTNIGGRIVDIEFDPVSPNIVYAAAATGGVFKSTDTGNNWFPIFDDQPCLSIGDIGIDPNNPDIIYVGTGEANGGHNNFPGLGIYKSVNGGQTWEFIGLDSTASIGRIIIDPQNSQKVFVAAVGSYFTPNPQRGVYLSEDGGLTWEKSLFVSDSTGAIDLIMDSQNSNILYAAMWERVRRPVLLSGTHLFGPTGGIYKTTDGGINWNKLGPENGLPDPTTNKIGRIGLSISESNPSIIYALYNDGAEPFGLYKSVDGGENWILTNDSFTGSSNFSWYFGQLRVHPELPETIFVLDVPLMKSSNSGTNWNFSYGYGGPSQLHVDHHALAFHPNNPNYIINGNDGGINISADGGETWSQPKQLPITQFYEIGLDETFPLRLYGGTQDNNTIRTLTGSTNDWQSIYGGDGFYVIVDPNNPEIIYAESQFGGLGKSSNGGTSFSWALNGVNSNEPTNWSTPVVMDPNFSNVLYYGTHTLYRTENSAELWNAVSPQLTEYTSETRTGTITTIAVAPSNSDVIYVGTDDGLVWVSSDYGINWKDISAELPFRWVTRVTVDPKDENVVYATFSGLKWADPEPRVFKSDNMGETWNNISSNLPDAPVNAFTIDYNNTDVLYLGNDVGAFVSYNKGESWEILTNDLPIVVVNDMKIHKKENYLAIGTHGRGMYKIDLNEIVKSENVENNLPANFELYQNYPNPFNPTTTIEYTIPSNVKSEMSNGLIPSGIEGAFLQLVVYDVLGREISTLVNHPQKPGHYSVKFDGNNLTSGIYYYKLTYDSFSQTKKMILLK
ncbi:MAG: T9SS type A sorting domain-containing protein [Ignavibacteriales bacterium]|nr:T9SS type A sorting domain-containing protein [Ignavibacteriales bacterium]